jgi:Ser/Thr protein kinase RdoA (MazF antagonist)/ribosomal protein S18 acetylase RimI-like enzyme
MQVQTAAVTDFDAWLDLAREVEPLFGPMVAEPTFHAALRGHIERETALCVREAGGPPGTPLLAGILISRRPSACRIDWLAVAARARGRGLGTLLLSRGLALMPRPSIVSVVTFGPDNPAGEAARRLYERFGFVAAEITNPGTEGQSRQVFRLKLGQQGGASMTDLFPVTYTTLSAASLAKTVLPAYAIDEPIARCHFYTPGMNDTYQVQTQGGRIYYLRVYRTPRRTKEDVAYELDALRHLQRKGVPVAWPIARRDGGFITTVTAPEGRRHVALFTEAPGVEPSYEEDPAGMAARYGLSVAEMHNALDDFASPHRRAPLDLEHLIAAPLAAVTPFLDSRPADQAWLEQAAAAIAVRIETLPATALEQGFCHGDLQGYHAHLTDDGTLTHFDFDFCGHGYRAYDLAVFRWCALLSEKQNVWWEPYLTAYQELRTLADLDAQAIPLFVCARVIWHMGLHADNVSDWGTSGLNNAYFERQFRRLRTALSEADIPS